MRINEKDVASFSLPCGFRLECVLHLGLHVYEKAVSLL